MILPLIYDKRHTYTYQTLPPARSLNGFPFPEGMFDYRLAVNENKLKTFYLGAMWQTMVYKEGF